MPSISVSFASFGPTQPVVNASFASLPAMPAGGALNVGFAQLPTNPLVFVEPAPASVSTGSVGVSTATITWVSSSSNETGFEVQIEEPAGSGNWVAASGAANPTAQGESSFAATGLVGPLLRARVRTLSAGGPSSYTVSAIFGLDNSGGGGGPTPGGFTGLMAAREAAAPDRVNFRISFSVTYSGRMASVETGSDRFRANVAVAATQVNGGFLAALAAEFAASRAKVGLFIDSAQVLEAALRATRFYAGWAMLDDPSARRGVFSITGSTYVLPDEWAIIKPLFLLYVEREEAIAIESSRVAGVDAVGRDSGSVEADIRQVEATLPQLAYVEPAWSVGFCPPAGIKLCDG